MQTILFIVGFFTLGYVARRFIADTGTAVKWLNNYIVYIAMPAIILVKIPALEFSLSMLIPAGFAWVWALIGGLTMMAISRSLQFARPLEGAAILLTILGNTSFLGYPMIQAFFNDEVLSYAIFYDQLGSFLMLSTAGLIIIALYAPQESGHTVIEPALTQIGKTLMPLALLVIGLQFQPQLLPEHRLPLGSAIVVKMIIAPILAYGFFNISNTQTAITQATIFEAAMPCMITPGIMAIQAGLSPRFCATLLGYSTLFSFAWLPFVAALIG